MRQVQVLCWDRGVVEGQQRLDVYIGHCGIAHGAEGYFKGRAYHIGYKVSQ